MAEKVLAFEEVAKHNKKGDCWLIIDGKVYDVSQFIEEHPGGDEVMLNSTGKDATVDFEDVGHSSYALKQREELLIGHIDKSTLPGDEHTTFAATSAANRGSSDSSKLLLYVLPLLILGVAFLLRFYYKKE